MKKNIFRKRKEKSIKISNKVGILEFAVNIGIFIFSLFFTISKMDMYRETIGTKKTQFFLNKKKKL